MLIVITEYAQMCKRKINKKKKIDQYLPYGESARLSVLKITKEM